MQRFFLLSLLLAFGAVALQLLALDQVGRGSSRRAQVVTANEREKPAVRAEANSYSNRGIVIGYVGLGFCVSSIALVVVSARRREPAQRSVVIGVLFVYLLLMFLQV